MICVMFLTALICLASADTPKDDNEGSQRLVQFGLNARFYNALKKDKEPHTGINTLSKLKVSPSLKKALSLF